MKGHAAPPHRGAPVLFRFQLSHLMMLCLALFYAEATKATPSQSGPSGFVKVPDSSVIERYSWELSLDHSNYEYIPFSTSHTRSSANISYGVFRNTEVGIKAFFDSRDDTENISPWAHLKYRFPGRHPWLGHAAAGFIFDADSDDYSSIYMMVGPFGFGFNLGGKSTTGRAPLGGCNHEIRTDPATGLKRAYAINAESAFMLFGHEIPLGESGASLMMEYNGDTFGGGIRYRYAKVFSADITAYSPGNYWHLDRLDGLGFRRSTVTGRISFHWNVW